MLQVTSQHPKLQRNDRYSVPQRRCELAAAAHEPSGAIEQVCAFSSLASPLHLSSSHCNLQHRPPLQRHSKHRSGIPGSELLERLLVVGVVGVDVASEPASRDGEGSALDGLLHEERPLGRAGERSGARAGCAADEGGDGHCEGVVCGVGRSGDGRVGDIIVVLLCWATALLRCRRRRIGSFRVRDLARRGKHVPGWSETSGFAYNLLYFCFYDDDESLILSEILWFHAIVLRVKIACHSYQFALSSTTLQPR